MDVAYTVRRSAKRRTLRITVERDRSVVVHAPLKVSEERIQQVVADKLTWIFAKTRHSQKYHDLPHPPGKELVSGESALYLGRQYQIEIVRNRQEEIQFSHRFLIPAQDVSTRRESMRAWYFDRANQKILPRVERHARDLGVRFERARIVDNRYRWGSCTPKNNLNLNWRLIKAPMFVVDYVIVHELAHLLESNHTARFWNIVRTQLPTTEKARTWLKEHGQVLEQDI